MSRLFWKESLRCVMSNVIGLRIYLHFFMYLGGCDLLSYTKGKHIQMCESEEMFIFPLLDKLLIPLDYSKHTPCVWVLFTDKLFKIIAIAVWRAFRNTESRLNI